MEETLFETTEKTQHTPEGETTYEVVTCKSCGHDRSKEEAKEFVYGDLQSSMPSCSKRKFYFKKDKCETGYLCEYCASTNDAGELAAPFSATQDNTQEDSFVSKVSDALRSLLHHVFIKESGIAEDPLIDALLFTIRACLIAIIITIICAAIFSVLV